MGGMGSDRERDHFLHIKEEMEHDEAAFYKNMLAGHPRELLTAGKVN